MFPKDFDDHFQKTSDQIDRVHKMMPVFMVISIIIALLVIAGLGLGVYWAWGVVVP